MKAGWRKGMSVEHTKAALGPAGHRREPDGQPLHGAEALDGVLGHRDARGKGRQLLPRRGHHDDRPLDRSGQDGGGPVEQRRTVPLQPRLGLSHPRGAPAREHDARRCLHLRMLDRVQSPRHGSDRWPRWWRRGVRSLRRMTFLVTGAMGKAGRHVVDSLLAEGQKVRALTRHPGKAAFPPQVEVVRGISPTPVLLTRRVTAASSACIC